MTIHKTWTSEISESLPCRRDHDTHLTQGCVASGVPSACFRAGFGKCSLPFPGEEQDLGIWGMQLPISKWRARFGDLGNAASHFQVNADIISNKDSYLLWKERKKNGWYFEIFNWLVWNKWKISNLVVCFFFLFKWNKFTPFSPLNLPSFPGCLLIPTNGLVLVLLGGINLT